MTRRIGRTLLLVLALAFMMPALSAQEKGSIKGLVKDAKTKEGLPVVNVKVKGTYYGAVTDMDGNYIIANVNPGSYVVEFTLLGYTAVQVTDVRVQAGKSTELNQNLSETVLSLGQEVVVVGEKPLLNVEETSSKRSVTADDLKATAVVNVKDVVGQQVGVVEADNEVHIRGGRASENAYLLDGISVQDPLAGTGFGLQLSADAVQQIEVITGGYNAEYGQATSGVVNVQLKDGSDRFEGSVGVKRDNLGIFPETFKPFNSESYEGSLSGPIPVSAITDLVGLGDIGTNGLRGAEEDGCHFVLTHICQRCGIDST